MDDSLRTFLLRETLRHAIHRIPFYASRDGLDPDCLASFPIVERRQLRDRFLDFVALDRFPDATLQTGGTTGDPAILFRTVNEYQASFVHRTGISAYETLDPDGFDTFAINLIDANHGMRLSLPQGQPIVDMPLEHLGNIASIRRLLAHGLTVKQRHKTVGALIGTATKLMILTAHLKLEDSKPSDLSVVVSHGFHLPSRWRGAITEFWSAPVSEVYGMTEFDASFAEQCTQCNGFLMPGNVIVEILDSETREPALAGVGVLVLTSLVPFVVNQPLIRYWTGDVVSVERDCPTCSGLAVRFRGRVDQVALARDPAGARQVLLDTAAIVDTLSEDPDAFVDNIYQQSFYRGRISAFPGLERVGYTPFTLERVGQSDYRLSAPSLRPSDSTRSRIQPNLDSKREAHVPWGAINLTLFAAPTT